MSGGTNGTVFRWDLDKTYLRSDFDSIRDLLRVPFEKATDKVDIPGVTELIRGIQAHADRQGRTCRVYFISASPPQIGRAIREKFRLDGVRLDGIVFKDQLQILLRGRFRGLREQVGYKLSALLRGRIEEPAGDREFLFGDDWESDPIIYSLYADLLRGRIDAEELEGILRALDVHEEWRDRIRSLLPALDQGDFVKRIFINLERQTPPRAFREYGSILVPTFNYFQTAACIYEHGEIDVAGVGRVGQRLIERVGYTPEMLENSLEDVHRRGHLREGTRLALAVKLRDMGVVPPRRIPVRRRLGHWMRRWVGRSPDRDGEAYERPNYRELLEARRGKP